MDNESQYSGYSHRSSHSHSSRKHRDRRDRHQRSKSRESNRGHRGQNGQSQSAPLLDDHWADNVTIVTATSERSMSRDDDHQSAMGAGEDIEELQATAPGNKNRRLATCCRVLLGCALGLPPLLTPLIFVLLPRLLALGQLEGGGGEDGGGGTDPVPQPSSQPPPPPEEGLCAQLCDGAHLALAVKLLLLLPATWALFLRSPLGGARLPRLSRAPWLLRLAVLACTGSHWAIYATRGMWRPEADPQSIVGLATACTDALLWLQYAGLLLLQVSTFSQQRAFCLKVTRNTDGESRSYNVGHLSIQRAALWVLEHYYRDFPIHNPNLPNLPKAILSRKMTGFKLYSLEEESSSMGNCVSPPPALMASAQWRRNCHSELYYEQADYERRVRKRKARLVVAVERAFSQVRRVEESEVPAGGVGSSPRRQPQQQGALDPREAAQAIFAPMAHALQKYLRTTRQHHCHNMEAILNHLQFCLTHNLTPQAFLERYLSPGPTLQYQSDTSRRQESAWTLQSELSVTRGLHAGVVFSLHRPQFTLVVTVTPLPFLQLREEFVSPKSHRFTLRLQSETSV
ncbi:vang-like protein 2 [Engraulis encrasicolus]|uniref:vang-like protein 2 n=1 Tax=Engraulis encrasicolus TaxID=184585 RepID=UPI002FD3836A